MRSEGDSFCESGKPITNPMVLIPKDSWRSEGDSNPRCAFDAYTLSRRASSATRASLQKSVTKILYFFFVTDFDSEYF